VNKIEFVYDESLRSEVVKCIELGKFRQESGENR